MSDVRGQWTRGSLRAKKPQVTQLPGQKNCALIGPPSGAMARSRTILAPLVTLACLASLSWTFIAPRPAPEIAAPAVLAALAPAAAQAVEMPEVGSSVSTSATVEALMLGIVLGTVPITVLGLFVSAWLQFKKGPTLGI